MEVFRKSGINKISGGTAAQREAALNKYKDLFTDTRHFAHIEREKTAEENEIIQGVVAELNDFLQNYGAQPLPIDTSHIHILDENKLSKEKYAEFNETYSSTRGFYLPETQDIWIFGGKIKSPLVLAKILAHEIVHFISFNSVILQDNEQLLVHRLGLAIQDPKTDIKTPGLNLFNETNEATTEGLVKRFYPRLARIPALKNEYEKLEKAQKEHWDDLAYINHWQAETELGPRFFSEVESFGYPEFRNADEELFKEILKQHPDQFSSEEEVFAVFARAAMTGDIKHMASLVESLGRGAFRALARRKTRTSRQVQDD